MKMLLKKVSLKYLYLLSSFGVVLIACSVVGLMLYFVSARELLATNERQMVEKLESFANYLEMQRKVMEDVSYDITGKIYYKNFYYKRNAYYEIELLKEFEKYKNNSPLIDDYFLLYRDNDWVFRSTANKYRFDALMQAYGLADERERLYENFNSTQKFSLVLCKDPGILMLAFPVYTSGRNDENGAGTIVFVISAERLQERLEALIGHVEGEVHLFWNGIYIMNMDVPETRLQDDALTVLTFDRPVVRQKDKSTYYVARSGDGLFALMLYTPPDFTFKSMERFLFANNFYLVAVILLLLVISILVGYNNYLPIKRLTSKYLGSSVKDAGKNELQNVECLFDSILQKKEEAEASLQEQYGVIKQQILNLVLDGNDWYIKLVSKPFMGIHLEGPLFYIMAIRIEASDKDTMEPDISDQVEELSENGMRLYFVNTRCEDYYAVIISAPDKSLGNDAVDYAQTLLREKYDCHINVSPAFCSLQKIHDFFMTEVQTQRQAGEGINQNADSDKHYNEMMMSVDKISKHVDDLLTYIADNYQEPGMSLDLLSEKYKLSTRYISNIIKEKTGLTYKEYLTNLRIMKAQELLMSKNMTVTEVCESVGYMHLPHFIKKFKHITGFTPSNYSQRNM